MKINRLFIGKKLPPVLLCLTMFASLLAGCGPLGGPSAAPIQSSAPAVLPTQTVTAPTPSPSPQATLTPTPAPTPVPPPEGIEMGEGFTVPVGAGLPIGQYALQHGGFIYYCSGDTLWRVDGKLKGKTRTLKAKGAIRQFFFDAMGTPYYTEETPGGGGAHKICLYRYLDGKAALLADGIQQIARVDDKSVYFVRLTDTGGYELYAVDLVTGTEGLCLRSDQAKDFSFRGGMLYYSDQKGQLYTWNPADGQNARVFKEVGTLYYNGPDWALSFVKKGGKAYFEAYRYSDRSLRMIRLDASIARQFPTDMLFNVMSFDGKYLYLCYNGYENAATFFRVDAATGKAVKRLKADQCAAWCVSGTVCYAFTGTFTDGGAPRNRNVWACDMAAGTKTLLKRLSAKTGAVEAFAVAGGYIWGFGSTEKAVSAGGGDKDTLYLPQCLFTLPKKGGK